MKRFDVIISGAGPAGSTCALFLAKSGLKVLLLDKEKFPRDKVCADNKSWICTNIVKELGLERQFSKLAKQEITRMLFSSPSGEEITVELDSNVIKQRGAHYNVRRMVFDDFLFQNAKKNKNITTMETFTVEKVLREKNQVKVQGKHLGRKKTVEGKIIVGADGALSPTAFSLGLNPVVKKRNATNTRAYFKGVKCDRNKVELHYLKGVCPGYFWIFPVDGDLCNVGLGMATVDVEKRKVNTKELLERIIKSEKFAPRFRKAKRVSEFKTWFVTVGGSRKKICCDNAVLIGDAANTALTFSGEGVGPAMRSARIAAKIIENAFMKNDFSEKMLKEYEDELWKVIGPERKGMWFMEFLIKNPGAFDLMVKKANKSQKLRSLASEIGTDYKNSNKIWRLETMLELLK
jgi:geranylgeranyl reductase family protein